MATKVIIVGDSNAGKTSIIKSYINDIYGENSPPTIECGSVSISHAIDSKTTIVLDINDVNYHNNYPDAQIAIIVIDAERCVGTQSIMKWQQKISLCLPKSIPIIVLINKIDILPCGYNIQLLKQLCVSLGIYKWFEVSAKTNLNIRKAFDWIAKKIDSSRIINTLTQEYIEKYKQQCIKIVENSIYEVNGHTIGSWVYEVVIPRINNEKVNSVDTITGLMTHEEWQQFLQLLTLNEFSVSSIKRVLELPQELMKFKIIDKDGMDIINLSIFIFNKSDKFEDIDVNKIIAQKNHLITTRPAVGYLPECWQGKYTFIDADLFTKWSKVSTFAKRINEEYLLKGWTVSLDSCAGDKIKYDETKEILCLETNLETKLKIYEDRIKELEDVNRNLSEEVAEFKGLFREVSRLINNNK